MFWGVLSSSVTAARWQRRRRGVLLAGYPVIKSTAFWFKSLLRVVRLPTADNFTIKQNRYLMNMNLRIMSSCPINFTYYVTTSLIRLKIIKNLLRHIYDRNNRLRCGQYYFANALPTRQRISALAYTEKDTFWTPF